MKGNDIFLEEIFGLGWSKKWWHDLQQQRFAKFKSKMLHTPKHCLWEWNQRTLSGGPFNKTYQHLKWTLPCLSNRPSTVATWKRTPGCINKDIHCLSLQKPKCKPQKGYYCKCPLIRDWLVRHFMTNPLHEVLCRHCEEEGRSIGAKMGLPTRY